MATYSQASDAFGDARDGFVVAVRQELGRHGFLDVTRRTDKRRLWKHKQAKQTVLGVRRDRGQRFGAAHDPLDEAVLLVGGASRRDRLYLYEYAIWCWGEEWTEDGLLRKLDDRGMQAHDCMDCGDVGMPESIPFRQMLESFEQHRSDLEERFSPGKIESTLEELSKRYSHTREQLRSRLVMLLVPDANEGIPGGELPPGLAEPHRPDGPNGPPSIDFEAYVSGREAIDEQAPFQVTFEDRSCTDRATAEERVDEWLREPNPALGRRSPDAILREGDRALLDYLFGLIAGIECGVHS